MASAVVQREINFAKVFVLLLEMTAAAKVTPIVSIETSAMVPRFAVTDSVRWVPLSTVRIIIRVRRIHVIPRLAVLIHQMPSLAVTITAVRARIRALPEPVEVWGLPVLLQGRNVQR